MNNPEQPASFFVGQKVKCLIDMESDCRDEGAGIQILAKKGEILVVRKITNSEFTPIQISHETITDRSFGVRASEIELVDQPASETREKTCSLCEAGFPLQNGMHIPTQALGMIPVTPCENAAQTESASAQDDLDKTAQGVRKVASVESASAPTPRSDSLLTELEEWAEEETALATPRTHQLRRLFVGVRQLERELSVKAAEVQDLVKKATDLGEIAARNGDESRRLREALEKIKSFADSALTDDRVTKDIAEGFEQISEVAQEALSAPEACKPSLQVRDGEWVEKAAREIARQLAACIESGEETEVDIGTIIRKALSESPSDQRWRPIESAPDSRSVLIFIPIGSNAKNLPEGRCEIAYKTEPVPPIIQSWRYATGIHQGQQCGWPTHWRPLPEPPREGRAR